MAARQIVVEFVGDTSKLERSLRRAEILVARSWWRRTLLRIALWRADRKAT